MENCNDEKERGAHTGDWGGGDRDCNQKIIEQQIDHVEKKEKRGTESTKKKRKKDGEEIVFCCPHDSHIASRNATSNDTDRDIRISYIQIDDD